MSQRLPYLLDHSLGWWCMNFGLKVRWKNPSWLKINKSKVQVLLKPGKSSLHLAANHDLGSTLRQVALLRLGSSEEQLKTNRVKKQALESSEEEQTCRPSKESLLLEAPEGRQVGVSSRRNIRPRIWSVFWMKRQMAEEEAAWHALTLNQVHREGRETSDNSDRPAHAYAEGLGTRAEGNLFKSHSIPLFMRISRAGERRLQGVSGSAWSTAGCRLLIHDSMLNFT